MRQVADHSLWIGNAGDLRDARAVMALGIEAIVDVADEEPFAPLPRSLVRCRYPLSDGGDNPDWVLRLASESVAALLHAKVPVLVCCSAGMSRSVCVAAAGMAIATGTPFTECLLSIAGSGPADVSANLSWQMERAIQR